MSSFTTERENEGLAHVSDNIPIHELVAVTTAQAGLGGHTLDLLYYTTKIPIFQFVSHHCVIYWKALVRKAVDFSHVKKLVTRTVNSMRAKDFSTVYLGHYWMGLKVFMVILVTCIQALAKYCSS